MKKVPIRHRQTLLDIAMQEGGSVDCVFELAINNGISITEALSVGRELEVPVFIMNKDKAVLADYARKVTHPATGLNVGSLTGINYDPIPTIIY